MYKLIQFLVFLSSVFSKTNGHCQVPDVSEHEHVELQNKYDPDDIFASGTYTELQCKKGYSRVYGLTNEQNDIHCLEDGTWENKVDLKCKAMECPVPELEGYGWVRFEYDGIGDLGRIYCMQGYRIPGTLNDRETTIRCKDGSWTNDFVCEESLCKKPQFENGKLSDFLGSLNWTQGSMAHVECDDGYSVGYKGAYLECNQGTWYDIPICYRTCRSNDIENGFLEPDVLEHRHRGTYSCNPGYYRRTDSDVECREGVVRVYDTYSDLQETPICEAIPSYLDSYSYHERFTDASNGEDVYYRIPHNTTLNVSCVRGYWLEEPLRSAVTSRVVTHFGQWLIEINGTETITEQPPRCEEKPCHLIPDPDTVYKDKNGLVLTQESTMQPGSYLLLTCKSDDYEIRPWRNYDSMSCMLGRWMAYGGRTKCEPKSCAIYRNVNTNYTITGDFKIPDNFEFAFRVPHNTSVRVSCYEDEYHLGNGSTNSTMYCQYGYFRVEDNKNSSRVDNIQCISTVNCSVRFFDDSIQYQDLNGWGIYVSDSAEFGLNETIEYTCDEGPYDEKLYTNITCGESGWIPQPTCLPAEEIKVTDILLEPTERP